MLGLLGKIFGSDAVIAKGMELIDDAFESDAEARESKTQAKIQLMQAYAPFKLAQRYIALMFTVVFLLCFMIVLGLTLAGEGNPDDVLKVMEQFNVGWAMTTILLFYFGGGLMESVKRPGK